MYSVLFALAVFSLILSGLAPQLVRIRIRILRWLNWNGAANLLEKNFDVWVVIFRIVLVVIAVVMFYAG